MSAKRSKKCRKKVYNGVDESWDDVRSREKMFSIIHTNLVYDKPVTASDRMLIRSTRMYSDASNRRQYQLLKRVA